MNAHELLTSLGYTLEWNGWKKELERFTIYIGNLENSDFGSEHYPADLKAGATWEYLPIYKCEDGYSGETEFDRNYAWYDMCGDAFVWEDAAGGEQRHVFRDHIDNLRLWLVMSEADLLKSEAAIIESLRDC